MSSIDTALAAHRASIVDLMATAERAPDWSAPCAPGKWSPAQLIEHVARSLEESVNVITGAPSKFPTFPAFLHPVMRIVFFNRVVKNGKCPRAKTSKPFDPDRGPATPGEGRTRLMGAVDAFENACRARDASGLPASSGIFGRVSVSDYVIFQEAHARHHQKQLP